MAPTPTNCILMTVHAQPNAITNASLTNQTPTKPSLLKKKLKLIIQKHPFLKNQNLRILL